VKVCEALCPLCRIPVLKPAAEAVWLEGPSLTHVTVSPACTVTVEGPKLKSLIVTEALAAEWALGERFEAERTTRRCARVGDARGA
jgi:hypothetical protein